MGKKWQKTFICILFHSFLMKNYEERKLFGAEIRNLPPILCQNIRHEYFKSLIRNDKLFIQPWVIHQREVHIYTSLPRADLLGSTWENLTIETASGWSLVFGAILLPDLKPRSWFYLLSCRLAHPALVNPALCPLSCLRFSHCCINSPLLTPAWSKLQPQPSL